MSTFEFVEVGLPTSDDKEEWKKFWKSKSQSWRTEPRISKERQNYLTERRENEPDVEQGIYPFKDIKLSRADVEWLLVTHDNNRGPVNWNDERQRERMGLDLRGADLRDENLSYLPLAKLLFGATNIVMNHTMIDATAGARLQGASLVGAQLQGADLGTAKLQGANLVDAQLQGADLFDAQLQGADLGLAQLQGAELSFVQLQRATLAGAQLQGANLNTAQLQGAYLVGAQLQGANLLFAQLQGADLTRTQLQGVNLSNATLAGADHIGPRLADVQWGDTNLAVVDWSTISILGDEPVAVQEIDWKGETKVKGMRLDDYKTAVRAYRQLSVALGNQGLNEDAARFSYRSQRMQRKVFWYQRKFLSFLGSLFLDRLSGYGYKVGRCFFAYAFVIGVFAMIYHLLGTHPAWNEAIVISMTAFHGRGFFPEQFHPGDPQALAAAIEAFVGLLIEITLIATLTQRLFGK